MTSPIQPNARVSPTWIPMNNPKIRKRLRMIMHAFVMLYLSFGFILIITISYLNHPSLRHVEV